VAAPTVLHVRGLRCKSWVTAEHAAAVAALELPENVKAITTEFINASIDLSALTTPPSPISVDFSHNPGKTFVPSVLMLCMGTLRGIDIDTSVARRRRWCGGGTGGAERPVVRVGGQYHRGYVRR
jgi:hypothetical protein